MRDAQAVAGVNETINFQGRVANTDGTNVADGNYDFVFRLYKASSGGSAQWTETWNSGTSQVAVTNGIFRVALGTHASLSSLDFNDDSWYLSVEFNGDGEMDPRIRFASVPYALNAKTVSGLTVTSTTGTFTLASGKTFVVNNGLTFSGTDSTTFTFPSASGTVVTLDAAQTLTNKTIGPTGLVFSGATTDITTVSNEDFVISPSGTGKIGFGTTTPNAFFDVAGAASISGQLTLYTTPQIQSAANQTLIIGGDTTGFINLKPLDGAGAVVINAAAFEVYSASGFGNSNNFTSISADGDLSFVGTADYLIAPGGKYAFRYSGDENYGLFFDDGAASYDFRNGSAANVFRVSALSGTLVSAAYTTNGGLIYSTGSGVFTQLGAGTTGQCLNANTSAAPSWGSCGGGGSNWVLNSGLGILSPINNTLDLLWGGNATSSAKFAVLNIADGTPVASVSSGVDGFGTYFDANGNIQTTRNKTLTLGGSTTGNILLFPQNGSGRVGINTTEPGNTLGLDVDDNYGIELHNTVKDFSVSFNTVSSGSSGTGVGVFESPGGDGNYRYIFEFTDTGEGADVLKIGKYQHWTELRSSFWVEGKVEITGTEHANGATGKSSLIVNQPEAQDIFTASASSATRFKISNNGDLAMYDDADITDYFTISNDSTNTTLTRVTNGSTIGNVTINSSGTLTAPNLAGSSLTIDMFMTNGGLLYTNGSGLFAQLGTGDTGECLLGVTGNAPSWGSCPGGSGGSSNWVLNSGLGTLSPINNTLDFLIGGTATNSAKFGILNVAGETPVASLSAGEDGGMFLTADGFLSTTARQNLTIGNSSTYNKSGNVLLNPNGTGRVGIGLTGPAYKLDITNTEASGRGLNITSSGNNTSGLYITNTPSATIGYGANITSNGSSNMQIGLSVVASGGSTNTGISVSGTEYGIRIGTGSTQTLWIADGTNPTAASGGIGFGSSLDTNLYRSAASTLKTDDAFQAQSLATGTTIRIDSSGNLTDIGTTEFNGVTYTWPDADGSPGYVLSTDGAGELSWIEQSSGGSSNWVLNSTDGTLNPINNTLDFLLGGTATNSAKFAVLNIADGTPTASVSSGVDGYGTYFDANGNIQTTRNQTLTLGGDTTGEIQFKPGNSSDSLYLGSNGNVGIGAAAPSNFDLEIQRSSGTVDQSFFLAKDPGTVSAFASIDFSSLTTTADSWLTAYTHGAGADMRSLFFDAVNNVMYAGSGSNGYIYRCETSTLCDSSGDWAISYDTVDSTILTFTMDTINNVIYTGTGSNGRLYRCATSTGCDNSGDWTVGLDVTDSFIYSATFDTVNGILYVGTFESGDNGDIHRCDITSGCDASGDWTAVYTYPTVSIGIISLEYDSANGVIYAGTSNSSILRCATSTGCDDSGDWAEVSPIGSPAVVYDLSIDSANGVIYAATSYSGTIYRCILSTGCDVSGEWTTAYDSSATTIWSLAYDSTSGIMYAGSGNTGLIFSCVTSTGCDDSGDWATGYDATAAHIYSLAFDSANSVLYAGTYNAEILRHTEADIGSRATYTKIQALALDTFSGTHSGALIFNTAVSGGSSEVMRLANGMVGINNNSPISALHVTRPLTLPATGKALAVFDQIENQDIFTASSSGTARFTITRAGGLKLGTSEGSSGECLKSGGAGNAVVWGSCGGGGQTPWTSNIDADNFSLLDLGTNITARNGLTLGTGSNGNLTLTPNGSGDVVISGDGDTNLQVTFSAAPTVDMAVISNSGFGTTTNGVNGLTIDFVQGDDGDDTDTNSGLIVNVTSTSDDIDQVIGIGIGNLTKNAAMGVGLIIGTGWDAGLVIASGGATNSGLVYSGAGRPTKTITLSPEYPGAVLTDYYGAGTDTNITGAMTSDTDTTQGTSIRNYYEWERTVDSTQHFYTVAVRVTLPADFDDWASSNAVRVSYITESGTNTVSDLDVRIYNENDAAIVASDVDNASTSWTTVDFAGGTLNDNSSSEWDAAGETAVIYLRMGSASSNYVRVGDIQLNYLAKF